MQYQLVRFDRATKVGFQRQPIVGKAAHFR
jgi:hypothetical protein